MIALHNLNIVLQLIAPHITKDDGLADNLLDSLEEYVKDTNTKIDDVVVLPLIKALRTSFKIGDPN